MHDDLGWWMVFDGMWLSLYLGGFIALVVGGMSRLTRRGSTDSSPLDIARDRYTKGEIFKKQLEKMKKDLAT
ncbi:SHOCT domain-containing protein [Chloroflexota bacterium]